LGVRRKGKDDPPFLILPFLREEKENGKRIRGTVQIRQYSSSMKKWRARLNFFYRIEKEMERKGEKGI